MQKPALLALTRLYYGWYFQDTWRISKRITINPGLRYEMHRPTTERYNRYSNFDYDIENPLGKLVGMPLRGGLVFLNEDNRFSWNPRYMDFAPRFGMSVQLTQKLVLRTGYGLFYPTQTGTGDATGFSSTTPWTPSQSGDGITPQDLLRNPYPNGLIPALGSSEGLLTNIGRGAGGYQRDHPNGYMQNYSADFQYELGKGTVIEFGYAGHQGRKLVYGISLNDNQLPTELLSMREQLDARVPNPFFGYITAGNLATATLPRHRLLRPFPHFDSVTRNGQTSGGSSSYNAMLLKLSKQFSSGLMLISSYQWSKAIDNIAETEPSPGGAADGFRDSRNFRIERSLSAHDLPHSFVGAFVYELPVGKGKASWQRHEQRSECDRRRLADVGYRAPVERASGSPDRAEPHQPVRLWHAASERHQRRGCARGRSNAGALVQYGRVFRAGSLHDRQLASTAVRTSGGSAEEHRLLAREELPVRANGCEFSSARKRST